MNILLRVSDVLMGFNIAPSIGLYRLHHVLKREGFHCDVFDPEVHDEAEIFQRVEEGFYDVIGMTVTSFNTENDLDTLLKLRERTDKLDKTVLYIGGGQEAAQNYMQWLKTGLLDACFLGFAEDSLLDFCQKYQEAERSIASAKEIFESLEGIAYYNNDNRLIFTPSAPITQEKFEEFSYHNVLEGEYPYTIYWDKIREKRVDSFNSAKFVIETIRLYTTSHCPRKCGFCNSQNFLPDSQQANTIKIIMLTAEQLHTLVLHHVKKYGARFFLFSDDDFPVGNKQGINRLLDFCRYIIQSKKNGEIPEEISFSCQSRIADYLIKDKQTKTKEPHWELLNLMREAGFINAGLGVETFSNNLLKAPSVNKIGVTTRELKLVIDAFLKIGMTPQLFLILGIPESSVEDLIETIEIATEYLLKGADMSCTPALLALPGAPIVKKEMDGIKFKTWESPVNGYNMIILTHVKPENEVIAHMSENLDSKYKEEMLLIAKRLGWEEDAIFPKTLVAFSMFLAATKLVQRDDIAQKIEQIIVDKFK